MDNENLQRALSLGVEIQNRFHYGSPEYIKGERITAWAANRIRSEQKVLLVKKQKDDTK